MMRGEIWLLDFDPTIGSEIRKIRPAVIVNSNAVGALELKVVVPITDWKDHYINNSWMMKIINNSQNNLSKVSTIDTFQIRSVSHRRFVRKLGELTSAEMQTLGNVIALTLDLP